MISTSCYKNFTSDMFMTYSISGNRGKDANYKGKCYPNLAPKSSFWKIWHENIGVISEEENNKYYIEEYYKQVLSKLDPEALYNELNNSILLCYEDNMEFCHRHIVAAYLELFLDVDIPEVKINKDTIENIAKPEYIKKYLEDIIKSNINMHGFKSLRANYLFEKSEDLEKKADQLEKESGKCYDIYRQSACYLRCEADEAEANYNAKTLRKHIS